MAPAPKRPRDIRELFFLVRDQPTETVLEFLDNGLADPHARYLPPFQDLMFFAAARDASLGGAVEVAKRLAALDVPANSTDHMWQTPLFYAAREGNLECVRYLVDQGCEVNRLDVNGQTPVFYSVRQGQEEMTDLLIQLGASMDVRDKTGCAAREYARPKPVVPPQRKRTSKGQSSPDSTCKAHGTDSPSSGGDPKRRRPSGVSWPEESRQVAVPAKPPPAKSRGMAISAVGRPAGPQPLDEPMMAWASGVVRPIGSKASHMSLPQNTPSSSSRSQQPPPHLGEVLAERGEYYVSYPELSDVPRLRQLEREFVVEHAEMCSDEVWFSKQTPADWCALVNVIQDEATAQQAIGSIAQGTTPMHTTLQLVLAGAPGVERRIVGYVHIFRDGDTVDVSHLKVDRQHQGRGLGGLLMAGAARAGLLENWDVGSMRLVVLQRNVRAIQLYRKLGFADMNSMQKRVRTGCSKTVAWLRMVRELQEPLADFADSCESGVRI